MYGQLDHAPVLDDGADGRMDVLTRGAVPVASVVSANASPGVQEAGRGLRRGHVSASGAPSSCRRIATDWNRFQLTGGLYTRALRLSIAYASGFAAYLNIQPEHECIEVGSIVDVPSFQRTRVFRQQARWGLAEARIAGAR